MAAALYDSMTAALYDSLLFAAIMVVVVGCCSFGCIVFYCCGSHWMPRCLLLLAVFLLALLSLSAVMFVVVGCCSL